MTVRLIFGLWILIFSFANLSAKQDPAERDIAEIGNLKAMNNMLIVRTIAGLQSSEIERQFNGSRFGIVNFKQLLPDSLSISRGQMFLSFSGFDYSALVTAEEKLLRSYILEFDRSFSPLLFAEEFKRANPFIEIAEPYYLPEFLSYIPNDTHIGNQLTTLQLVKAFDAWAIEKGSSDVVIGISDSGVNQDHEDLVDVLAVNEGEIPGDGIDNDGNGYIDDYLGYNFAWERDGTDRDNTFNGGNSHGQEVAGIAAAKADNSRGIAGTSFSSKFIPIKIIENNRLIHAYPSIIYAAVRGCKVLNLSWGSPKPFSEIDQTIIDFAVARDVAIVAASGNIGSGGGTRYSTFYPAAYYGVLGVGESSINDGLDNGTVLGVQTHILAPGSLFTTKNSGYGNSGGGTSFSTPIVSGALALARARYPEMSALQSLQFVRRSSDIILPANHAEYIHTPGRLNMLKMVERKPSDIHGIAPLRYVYRNQNGVVTDRFIADDIVRLTVNMKNFLGEAENVRIVLKEAYDPANAVFVIDSVVTFSKISENEDFSAGEFSFMIFQNFNGEVIFRLEVYADNEEPDSHRFTFIPYKTISTFENDKLRFSVSDIGEFGFSTTEATPQGSGFSIKGYGNQLYRNSTLMVSEAGNRAVYTYGAQGHYDFKPIKRFIEPNGNISIIDDSFAGMRQIGLEIRQEVTLPSPTSDFARIEVKVKNVSASPLLDVSVGYFLDWDIGMYPEKNRTRLFAEAVPPHLPEFSAAAQIAFSTEDEAYPALATGVVGIGNGLSAQAAGLHYGITRNFSEFSRVSALNSGFGIQTDTIFDISMVIGMKFDGTLLPGQERICYFCIGGGMRDELAGKLAECLALGTSVIEDIYTGSIKIFPNPAEDVLNYISSGQIPKSVAIFDILGNRIISDGEMNANGLINVSKLAQGVYNAVFRFADGTSESHGFIISRQSR